MISNDSGLIDSNRNAVKWSNFIWSNYEFLLGFLWYVMRGSKMTTTNEWINYMNDGVDFNNQR